MPVVILPSLSLDVASTAIWRGSGFTSSPGPVGNSRDTPLSGLSAGVAGGVRIDRLAQRAPRHFGMLPSRATSGKIIAEDILGGLHHIYRHAT